MKYAQCNCSLNNFLLINATSQNETYLLNKFFFQFINFTARHSSMKILFHKIFFTKVLALMSTTNMHVKSTKCLLFNLIELFFVLFCKYQKKSWIVQAAHDNYSVPQKQIENCLFIKMIYRKRQKKMMKRTVLNLNFRE